MKSKNLIKELIYIYERKNYFINRHYFHIELSKTINSNLILFLYITPNPVNFKQNSFRSFKLCKTKI